MYISVPNKKTLSESGVNLLIMNYDIISREDSVSDAIVRFYDDIEKSFESFCDKTLKKQALILSKNKGFRPFGAIKKHIISRDSEDVLCVVTDASFFDGKKRRMMRASQIWNVKNQIILRFSDFFNQSSEKKITELVCEKLAEMAASGEALFDERDKSVRRHFRRENFFITESAVGFFFPAGILSEAERPVSVMIGFDTLDEYKLLKNTKF